MFAESLLCDTVQGFTYSNSFNPPNNPKHYSYELHFTHGEIILGSQCEVGLVSLP